jgi:hypothetical protein
LAENFSENNLKGDLPNVATFNPPLFSLVNTFKHFKQIGYGSAHSLLSKISA